MRASMSHISKRLFALLSLALFLTLSLTIPVQADGPLHVPANVQWTNTGIALKTGQRFTVRATGKISVQAAAPNKKPSLFTATGNSLAKCTDSACLLPNKTTGLL